MGGKITVAAKDQCPDKGGKEYVGGKYWGKLALGHYTMALGQFTFTRGLVSRLQILLKMQCWFHFYIFFISEMTSGMVLTIQGKVPSN